MYSHFIFKYFIIHNLSSKVKKTTTKNCLKPYEIALYKVQKIYSVVIQYKARQVLSTRTYLASRYTYGVTTNQIIIIFRPSP